MHSTNNIAKDLDVMAKALSEMRGHHVRKAMARATNRTLISVNEASAKDTEKEHNVKKHVIKRKTKVKKAFWKRIEGSLNVYQSPIPFISLVSNKQGVVNTKRLVGFKARKYKNKRTMLGGTRVKQRGANRFFHRGFVNVIRSSNRLHLMQRHGKETYKVRVPKLMTHITMNKVVPKRLDIAAQTTYVKILGEEYEKRLNGIIK